MYKTNLSTLSNKIQKFNNLENDVSNFINKSKTGDKSGVNNKLIKLVKMVSDANELKQEIELELAKEDYTNIKIENESVTDTLKKLRKGHEFLSIEVYKILCDFINKKADKSDPDSMIPILNIFDISFDDLFEDFHSWFDIRSYYSRKLQVSPLITSNDIPKTLIGYFSEIKESYAYCLYYPSISLCRVVLEICLQDKLSKVKDYQYKEKSLKKTNNKKEFCLFKCIDFAKEYCILNNKFTGKAHHIRKEANIALHGKRNKQDAFSIINDTIQIVEFLYR